MGNGSIGKSNHFTQVKQNVRFSLLKMAIKALSGRSNISLVCMKNLFFFPPFHLTFFCISSERPSACAGIHCSQGTASPIKKIHHHENLDIILQEKVNGINNNHLATSEVKPLGGLCLAALQQLLSSPDLFWAGLWCGLNPVPGMDLSFMAELSGWGMLHLLDM